MKNLIIIPISILLIIENLYSQDTAQNRFYSKITNTSTDLVQSQYLSFKLNPPPLVTKIDTSSDSKIHIRTKDGFYLFSYPKSVVISKYNKIDRMNNPLAQRPIFVPSYRNGGGLTSTPYHIVVGAPRRHDNLVEYVPPPKKKK